MASGGRVHSSLLLGSLHLPNAKIQLQFSRSDDHGVTPASPDGAQRHGPQLRADSVDVFNLRRELAGTSLGSDGSNH